MEFSEKLNQVNARLKSEQVKVRIDVKGASLILRATLPPKPGSEKTKPSQQKIYIGKPANLAGLRQSEKLARLLGSQLIAERFTWDEWLGARSTERRSCGEAIAHFEKHYMSQGGKQDTWEGDYWKIYKRLPQDATMTPKVLTALAEAIEPNTRTRKRAVIALTALSRFEGIDWDGQHLKGDYNPQKTAPRKIPDDKLISEYREEIANPAWRWVYGMMATYGLRNHEVFFLDLESFPVVKVLENTKTGYREVWPCYPEWSEAWQLHDRQLPRVKLHRANPKLGQSVTNHLSPKLPFTPYDLRHAWAIRTLLYRWPVELSARQMGHSVDLHTRTYQRWISHEQTQQVYDLLVNRSDRPRPPD